MNYNYLEDYISQLQAQGRYSFTIQELKNHFPQEKRFSVFSHYPQKNRYRLYENIQS